MKSLRRTRRLEDESCVHRPTTTTTILANRTTTTTISNSSIDTSIVSPANHHRCCHCPSGSSASSASNSHEDGDPSIIAMSSTCVACERLHGCCEFRSSDRETFDRLERTRENFVYPSNCLSFELPETGSSTTTTATATATATATMTTRIRTMDKMGTMGTRTKSRCKMPERNSRNSRYASSVVRWRMFCDWRLAFSVALFLTLAFPPVILAAEMRNPTSVSSLKENGEAGGDSHGGEEDAQWVLLQLRRDWLIESVAIRNPSCVVSATSRDLDGRT